MRAAPLQKNDNYVHLRPPAACMGTNMFQVYPSMAALLPEKVPHCPRLHRAGGKSGDIRHFYGIVRV
jgi:hypothetical protein